MQRTVVFLIEEIIIIVVEAYLLYSLIASVWFFLTGQAKNGDGQPR